MRHALLILAHENPSHLCRLVGNFLGDPDFEIFIHWCKKNPIPQELDEIRYHPRVHIYSVFQINWGGWNMCEATDFLISQALDSSSQYFHLLSGTDYLIKPLWDFKKFFENTPNTQYIKIDVINKFEKYPSTISPHTDLFFLDHRLDEVDIRKTGGRELGKYYRELQEQADAKLFQPLPPYTTVMGEQWWALPRESVRLIHEKFPIIRTYESKSKLPDNRFAQTILWNWGDTSNIVSTYLRYTRHHDIDLSHHIANLDERDFEKILKYPGVWARKFSSPTSDKLRTLLDTRILVL